jgi:hypothetical protein
VDWWGLFLDLGIYDCVEKFYIIIRECFDRFVSFNYSVDSENGQPWFDKKLRNLNNIRSKSHKYMKELCKIYIRLSCNSDSVSTMRLHRELVILGVF